MRGGWGGRERESRVLKQDRSDTPSRRQTAGGNVDWDKPNKSNPRNFPASPKQVIP